MSEESQQPYIAIDKNTRDVIWGTGMLYGEALQDGRLFAPDDVGLEEIPATHRLIDHVEQWGGDPEITPWRIVNGVADIVLCNDNICLLCNEPILDRMDMNDIQNEEGDQT